MAAGKWNFDTGTFGSTIALAFGAKPTPNPFRPAEPEFTPEERKKISDMAWDEMRSFFSRNAKRKKKKKPKGEGDGAQ